MKKKLLYYIYNTYIFTFWNLDGQYLSLSAGSAAYNTNFTCRLSRVWSSRTSYYLCISLFLSFAKRLQIIEATNTKVRIFSLNIRPLEIRISDSQWMTFLTLWRSSSFSASGRRRSSEWSSLVTYSGQARLEGLHQKGSSLRVWQSFKLWPRKWHFSWI